LEKELNFILNLIDKKDFESAKFNLIKLKENNSKNYSIYYLLGCILEEQKDFAGAIDNYKASILLNENFLYSVLRLANLYYKLKNLFQSESFFLKAIKIDSINFEAYYNLGIINFENNRFKDAISFFKNAIKLDNNSYQAHHQLGLTYEKIGEFHKAIASYNLANTVNLEGFFYSYNNLGNIHLSLKDFNKSKECFERALKLKGDNFASIYNNFANFYYEIAEVELAISFLEKAITEDEKNLKYYSTLLSVANYLDKDLDYYKKYFEKFNKNIPIYADNFLKNFNYSSDLKKIKIGFLSSDFRNHPIGYFLEDFLGELKKNSLVETQAYYDNHYNDELSSRLENNFDNWNNVYKLSDIELINLIRSDGIHILVDMMGHTYANRLRIFPNKPAPVQITWAAFLASTGLKHIDYILTDPFVTTEDMQNQFSEKILLMPQIWCPLSKSYLQAINTTKETPAKNNNFITFGSFNNIRKISDNVIKIWSIILKKVSNSKLYIKSSDFKNKIILDKFIEKFLLQGVDKENLILETESERNELLKSYNKIDIALDTFPYNGGTTSLEASWMCVPILTLKGNKFISRCGYSINKNLNMSDWIATNEDDYINKAILYSQDINELNKIRSKLQESSRKTALFDSSQFANDFVMNIMNIWNNYKKN